MLIPLSLPTQNIFFMNTNRLILFTEMIAVYSKNDTTPINTFCGKHLGLLDAQVEHSLINAKNMQGRVKLTEKQTQRLM